MEVDHIRDCTPFSISSHSLPPSLFIVSHTGEFVAKLSEFPGERATSNSRSNLTRVPRSIRRVVPAVPCHGGGNFSVSSSTVFRDRLCLESPSSFGSAARELPSLSSLASFISVICVGRGGGGEGGMKIQSGKSKYSRAYYRVYK